MKADPDEIFLNGADRKQLSDAIKNGSTANYRLNLTQTETGDYVGGAVIGGLHNEITGKCGTGDYFETVTEAAQRFDERKW